MATGDERKEFKYMNVTTDKKLRFKATQGGGYIALMLTIIISMVLLVMVAEEGFAGWHARFNVLGTEFKEQASALAEGCIDQTITGLVMGVSYDGETPLASPIGTCNVLVSTSTPGTVIINTQANVSGSYTNVGMAVQFNDVHIGTVPSAPTTGTLIIQTLVGVTGGGTVPSPSDFTMRVSGVTPTQTSFGGSATGVVVHVSPGAYNITEDSFGGYRATLSSDCAGTISGGDIKSCTVTNDVVVTTWTLVANVTNLFNGTSQPADVPLLLDGAPVVLGKAYPVTVGSHVASVDQSFLKNNRYTASPWGYDCAKLKFPLGGQGTISFDAGDNFTCVVNLRDLPPPAPVCADTVMMLDRTGSMNSTELLDQKTAANKLVSLYSQVPSPLPLPSLGVGSFGGITTATKNGALVPNNSLDLSGYLGILTTTYSDLTTAISKMMASNSCTGSGHGGSSGDSCTDLAAAINTASIELNSVRHKTSNEKVLLLITDGAPTLPSGTATSSVGIISPTANVSDGSTSWINPTNAYTAGDNGANATAAIGSGSVKHRYSNFNFASTTIPSDASISGVKLDLDAWSTSATGASSTSPDYPTSTGDFSDWFATGATKDYTALADTKDTTYIDTASTTLSDTMNVPSVSTSVVPSNAAVNSVTLYVRAEGTASSATMNLIVAKDSTHTVAGPTVSLVNGTYNLYAYTFTTTGDGKAWTQAEVASWTNSFGVRTTGGSLPRVAQMYVMVNYSVPVVTSTSSPTLAPSAVSSGGAWANPDKAYVSDNVYANDTVNGDRQTYTNFGFSIPSGALIQGIQLFAESKVSGSTSPTNTSTRYPTASGNYSSWSGSYSGINETGTTDCSSSDAIIDNTSNDRSSFKIDLSAVPDGSTINSVSIIPSDRSDSSGTAGTYKTFVRLNGTNIDAASSITVTSTSVCTSRTAQTITASTVKSSGTTLEIGVLKVNGGGSNGVRIGALNATINYTPVTSGSIGAELSWNNNSSRSNSETISLSTTEAVLSPSGNSSSDTWGSHSWVPGDFSNGNFTVRLTNNSSSGPTVSVDQLTSKVFYTTTATTTATTSAMYPSSGGDFSDWSSVGTSHDYDALKDSSDSTYIDTASLVFTDTMNVANISSNTITSSAAISAVTLYVRAEGLNTNSSMNLVVAKDSTHTVAGPAVSLVNGTYNLYSYTFPTTGDGKTWTQSEVISWTNSFGVRTTGTSLPRVAQMYVVVTYSMPSNCQIGADLSWDGGTTWTSEKKTSSMNASSTTYTLGSFTDTWSHTWALSDFSNANFRARVHAVDPGSSCQSTDTVHLDWMRMNVTYSSTPSRINALQAADAAKLAGTHIFSIYYNTTPVTADKTFLAEMATGDNPYPPYQSGSYSDPDGYVSSSVTAAASKTGIPSGWANPQNGYSADSKYTTSATVNVQQGYTGFGLVVPPASTINGVEVDLSNTKLSSSKSSCYVGAEISTDNGITFTSSGYKTSSLSTSGNTKTIGGTTSLWNRTWTSSDFDPAKVVARITDLCSGTTINVDQVKMKVSYTSITENSDGDNFFIAPTSADMPAIFNFIGDQVCPAALNLDQAAPPTTANLMVITRVNNDNSGTKLPADFTVNVLPGHQSQSSSAGVDTPGTNVTLNPDTFSVTENPVSGYTETFGEGCFGDASSQHPALIAGETRVCIVTNDDVPPPPPPPNLTLGVGTSSSGSWWELP